MKNLLILLLCAFAATVASANELKPVAHRVIEDRMTFPRDDTDRRYSVWTDDPAKAGALLAEFQIAKEVKLAKGEVLAVFLNDRITESLVQVTRNADNNKIFADYADSGIRFKLVAAPEGKKYSHLTAVVFAAEGISISHLGMRGMVTDGLSEKKE